MPYPRYTRWVFERVNIVWTSRVRFPGTEVIVNIYVGLVREVHGCLWFPATCVKLFVYAPSAERTLLAQARANEGPRSCTGSTAIPELLGGCRDC